MAYYELKKAASGQVHFNLKAGNHEVILTSELYERKESALKGIASVQSNGIERGNFEMRTAKDGSPYFVLKAQNGEVIGRSEMYSSLSAAEKGLASVIRNSAAEEIKELE